MDRIHDSLIRSFGRVMVFDCFRGDSFFRDQQDGLIANNPRQTAKICSA